MKFKKGDVEWDTLIPWIIAVAVLVVVAVLYFTLSGRLGSAGEFIKNFFRFKI